VSFQDADFQSGKSKHILSAASEWQIYLDLAAKTVGHHIWHVAEERPQEVAPLAKASYIVLPVASVDNKQSSKHQSVTTSTLVLV